MAAKRNNRALGAIGEELAVELLKETGYTVIQQNYRCKHGEIDIIAKEGGTIVFVEVKTRRNIWYGTPEEAVGYRKQRQLKLLAAQYLARYHDISRPCRFDVVSILLDRNDKPVSLKIIENCL